MTARTCLDCSTTITRHGKSGCCRPCAARRTHADPAFRARLEAASRAAKRSPASRARASEAALRTEAERRGDPAWHAYKVASGRRLRAEYDASPEAQLRNSAMRAAAGRKISDTRHAWCPIEYRPAYRAIRDKDVPAAEARRMVEELILADRAREAARFAALPLLERQLARVAAGAKVVPTFKPQFAGPSYTLGGVAPEAM
ncbi:hypothetical protein [Sphingomonas sp.]|uniref:hypothetical protein n=1 Tax=Sphingomonas sp. TaxID=28214 RepID=UPI003B004A55